MDIYRTNVCNPPPQTGGVIYDGRQTSSSMPAMNGIRAVSENTLFEILDLLIVPENGDPHGIPVVIQITAEESIA